MFITISHSNESMFNNNNSRDLYWNEYLSFIIIIFITILLGICPWLLLVVLN